MLLPEEVSDVFAAVGRCQSFSWMTFHRNPYCWHGLMNYLQVDPLARGFLYGLANINAVGWQEATFVLLKLIDEKAIAEACRQENRGYYQKSNDRQGARTPSKRAMCYVKKAMDNHSITRNCPVWDQSNQLDWVMTAWHQRLAFGATMNQPESGRPHHRVSEPGWGKRDHYLASFVPHPRRSLRTVPRGTEGPRPRVAERLALAALGSVR